MLLAILSDLHIDYSENLRVVLRMIDRLKELQPDLIVLAGDLASDLKNTSRMLKRIQEPGIPVAYVPGNHDLWSPTGDAEDAGHDTWRVYREILPEICRQLGIHYLPEKAMLFDKIAFVGSTGWYDYSLASSSARMRFSDADFKTGLCGGMGWADVLRTCYRNADGQRMSDAEVTDRMLETLRRQLESLPPEVESVVAVTHFLAFPQCVPQSRLPTFDFFSAFMGSKGFGELFQRDPRVKLAIYGHSHTPGDQAIDGLRMLASPLGYPRERRKPAEDPALSRMAVVELE